MHVARHSTPRIYYHSLRRIQARARCAGYDRHQAPSIDQAE